MKSVQELPVTRLLPNILTMLSLSAGLTAVRMALYGKWEAAAMAIVVAGVFDILDGRVARMLNIASKFGAELDSLADVISFGVAPALVIYLWNGQMGGSLGWVAVLVYAICAALRLARFNTMTEDHDAPAWTKRYFTGIPAPAGAGLALLPLFLTLEYDDSLRMSSMLTSIWLIILGGLMVSRLPTLSLKGRRVAPVWVAPIMLAVVLLIAALITNPWITLAVLAILYLASLPYGWYSYTKRQKMENQGHSNA